LTTRTSHPAEVQSPGSSSRSTTKSSLARASHPPTAAALRRSRLQAIKLTLETVRHTPTNGDPHSLLDEVCKTLAASAQYDGIWGRLLRSESGDMLPEGKGRPVTLPQESEAHDSIQLAPCFHWALEPSQSVMLPESSAECTCCPMRQDCNSTARLILSLSSRHAVHGVLSIGQPPNQAFSSLETAALRSLASAIAAKLDEIDDYHRLEGAHVRSSDLYRTIFENTGTAMWIIDGRGLIALVNRQFEALTGYQRQEVEGIFGWERLFHPDDLPVIRNNRNRRLAGMHGAPDQYEVRLVTKDGNVKHVLKSAGLIPQSQSIVSSLMDITGRRQAEQEIHRLNEYLSSVVESADVLLIGCDINMKIGLWNRAAETITGHPRTSVIGGSTIWTSLYPDPPSREQFFQAMQEVQQGTLTNQLDTLVTTKSGEKRTVAWQVRALVDQQNNVFGVVCLGRDVTDERHALAAQREAEAKAQRAQRLASIGQMAAGVAHEINNPTTGIIGFADLLLRQDLPEDAREYASLILEAGRRVAGIVEQLLAFARWKAPVRQPVALNSVLQTALRLRQPHLKDNDINVVTDLDPLLPSVLGDQAQLEQVFLNIICNAETEMRLSHGSGTLSIVTRATGASVVVALEDSGPGITQDHMDHIFDPFFTTRDIGQGTGLGLSICHGILSEHGGRISAANNASGGATFTIELPVAKEDPAGLIAATF
jgi:two-component system NtrC family sensor kinase